MNYTPSEGFTEESKRIADEILKLAHRLLEIHPQPITAGSVGVCGKGLIVYIDSTYSDPERRAAWAERLGERIEVDA